MSIRSGGTLDFTFELEQLDKGDRSPDLIKQIIEKHDKRAKEIKAFYERYKAKDVPIFKRIVANPQTINNQINNDFFSEIIDVRTGYFAGNEISYIVNAEAEAAWKEFKQRNRLADLDSETTKHAGIGGYSARLLYIDEDGKERVTIVPAWESILIGDKGIDEPKYGVRPYVVQTDKEKTQVWVELYEGTKVTEYRGDNVESLAYYDERLHGFDICPMWGYMNNDELQGEAEKGLALMDAYDRVLSDIISEIEAFRGAYLAFFGVEPPDEVIAASFAENGTFYFSEGQSAQFITKPPQTEASEAILNRLHETIYLVTKTPNFRDKNLGGVPSGIALKHMMQPLENKTMSFERKFTSGNIRMFEILSTSWAKRRINLKPYDVEQKYTRNFPKDMLYEAQVQVALKGMVTEETRLALFPGVQDAVAESKALEKQQDDIMKKFQAEQELVNKKLGDE
jgi:SPP1 family phage portal protein